MQRSKNLLLDAGKDAMVYGFPVSNGTLYYPGVTIFKNGPAQHDQWMVKSDISGLQERFKDWDDYVRKQVELVPNDSTTLGWSIWEMPPAPTYYKGRVAIMGDVAHASTPYQGAGAGQTIEDSLVMERLLGKYFDPTRDRIHTLSTVETIHLVFQAFDTVRRHRSQKVQTTSSETGRILTGTEPGVSMKSADMSERMDGRQDWMWNYDQ
jgi:salicylate hydroxylase